MNCTVHEAEIADWQCLGCDNWCCEECVKVIETRTVDLEVCRSCGSMLNQVMVSADVPKEDLRTLAMRALTPEAAITAAGIALPGLLAGYLSPMWVLYFGMLSTYYLQVVEHVGRGRPGMPHFGDSANLQAGFGGSIARGVAVGVIVLTPYILWRFGYVGIDNDSIFIVDLLMVLTGMLYAPAAILAMILAGATLAGAWIPAWIHIVRTDRRGYLQLTKEFLAATGAWLVSLLVLDLVIGWLPFLGTYVVALLSTLVLLVQAVWVGAWLMAHHEDFEFRQDVDGGSRLAAARAAAVRETAGPPGSPSPDPPSEDDS